jgi:hypothetical protein
MSNEQQPFPYERILSEYEQINEPVQRTFNRVNDIRTDQSLDEAARSAQIASLLQNEGYTMKYLTQLDEQVEALRLAVEHEWKKLDGPQIAGLDNLRADLFVLQTNIKQLQFEHPEQQRRFNSRLEGLRNPNQQPLRKLFLRKGRQELKEIEGKLARKTWGPKRRNRFR